MVSKLHCEDWLAVQLLKGTCDCSCYCWGKFWNYFVSFWCWLERSDPLLLDADQVTTITSGKPYSSPVYETSKYTNGTSGDQLRMQLRGKLVGKSKWISWGSWLNSSSLYIPGQRKFISESLVSIQVPEAGSVVEIKIRRNGIIRVPLSLFLWWKPVTPCLVLCTKKSAPSG